MNFLQKFLCVGLVGFFSMTAMTNMCAMEKKEPTRIETFMTNIIGRINSAQQEKKDAVVPLYTNGFARYFTLDRKKEQKGERLVYELYCTEIIAFAGAGQCSAENIQKLFEAIFQGFRDIFWKLSDDDARSSMYRKLKEEFQEKKPVFQLLDACLNFDQFSKFCTARLSKNAADAALDLGYKQVFKGDNEKNVELLRKIFAGEDLQRALRDLKERLVKMLDEKPEEKSADSTKKQQASYAKYFKRFKQYFCILTPTMLYSTFMITRRWYGGGQVPYVPILRDAVFFGGCCEALKMVDARLGCTHFVKRNLANLFSKTKKS